MVYADFQCNALPLVPSNLGAADFKPTSFNVKVINSEVTYTWGFNLRRIPYVFSLITNRGVNAMAYEFDADKKGVRNQSWCEI